VNGLLGGGLPLGCSANGSASTTGGLLGGLSISGHC
jgi:hypothetical protein